MTDVAFNNLVCAQLPLAPQPAAAPAPGSGTAHHDGQRLRAAPANSTLQTPSPLYVQYAPVCLQPGAGCWSDLDAHVLAHGLYQAGRNRITDWGLASTTTSSLVPYH